MEKIKAFFKRTWGLFKSDTWCMIFVVFVSMILGASLFGGSSEPAPMSESKDTPVSTVSDTVVADDVPSSAVPEYTLHTGDVLDVKTYATSDGGNGLIIKTKIQSLFTTDQTIRQNYHNVCGIITDQGGDKYDEIKYWAVADMTNGSEQKVIQFTVDAQTIQDIKNEYIFATQLETRLKDLWILPSLTE